MSPTRSQNYEDMRGFSLLELLISSVVLIMILGMIAAVAQSVQQSYARQRPRMEAVNDATAAMDTIIRVIRMAGSNPNNIANFPSTTTPAIVPSANSIRLRADWNPADGALNDPYEDIEFTVSNGVLFKQERSLATADAAPVAFLPRIESLTLTYYDINNNVTTSGNAVASVNVVLITGTPDGSPMTFSSSASVRRLER